MRKGKNRRYREARQLKRTEGSGDVLAAFPGDASAERDAATCDECRRSPHADWCMAEQP